MNPFGPIPCVLTLVEVGVIGGAAFFFKARGRRSQKLYFHSMRIDPYLGKVRVLLSGKLMLKLVEFVAVHPMIGEAFLTDEKVTAWNPAPKPYLLVPLALVGHKKILPFRSASPR